MLYWAPFYYMAGFRTGAAYAATYVFCLVSFSGAVGECLLPSGRGGARTHSSLTLLAIRNGTRTEVHQIGISFHASVILTEFRNCLPLPSPVVVVWDTSSTQHIVWQAAMGPGTFCRS